MYVPDVGQSRWRCWLLLGDAAGTMLPLPSRPSAKYLTMLAVSRSWRRSALCRFWPRTPSRLLHRHSFRSPARCRAVLHRSLRSRWLPHLVASAFHASISADAPDKWPGTLVAEACDAACRPTSVASPALSTRIASRRAAISDQNIAGLAARSELPAGASRMRRSTDENRPCSRASINDTGNQRHPDHHPTLPGGDIRALQQPGYNPT